MSTEHHVVQGDSVVKLAYLHGLMPATIWNHPANRELKTLRQDMNVLMPGDVVVIPEKEIKEEPRPVEQRHLFRRKAMRALYRLQVFDVEEPRAEQDYELTVDGRIYQGQTDKSGTLEEYLPPDVREGELVIGEDRARLVIRFGYLDPIDEISGMQKRLNNLGFDCGDNFGEINSQTADALRTFQRRFGLTVSGELDSATRQQLEDMHDRVSEFPPQEVAPASDSSSDQDYGRVQSPAG